MKKKKGMTLIELVASLAIFAIIILGFMTILGTAINYNSINKRTYTSNTESKALFEILKANRPVIPTGTSYNVIDGDYRVGISDKGDIKDFGVALTSLDTVTLNANYRINSGTANNLNNCNDTGSPYCMGIRVNWNDVKGVYEIETWTWDAGKGDVSEINRKTYLAPK